MVERYTAEIRHIETPEDPLFEQARLVNDAAHRYELSWLNDSQQFVAMTPDTPDRVAGVIQFLDSRDHARAGYGDFHITRLAVDPSHRRRGIASALVAHTVQVGLESGITTVSAQPMNTEAGIILDRQGFVYARREGKIGDFRYLELKARP